MLCGYTLPLLGGLLFFGNASFYLLAYFRLEGSIVMMLHQLNAVWLLLLGVFALRIILFTFNAIYAIITCKSTTSGVKRDDV